MYTFGGLIQIAASVYTIQQQKNERGFSGGNSRRNDDADFIAVPYNVVL